MYKNKLMTRTNKINEYIKAPESTLANEVTSGDYFRFLLILNIDKNPKFQFLNIGKFRWSSHSP